MQGTPADSFRAALEAHEIVVEFGRAGGESMIALSDGVRMPIETAKRLVLALDEPLARHAARARPARDPLAGHTPVNAPPDEAASRGALLLRLVTGLGVPHQHERSFRLSAGSLLANRFLLTLDAADVSGDACGRVLGICGELEMPPALREAAERDFAAARCVHFGFEAGPGSLICKLYLERAISGRESKPVLLHRAFKWDLVKRAHVVTEYVWHPLKRVEDIEARLREVYRGGEPAPSYEIARELLHLAAARAPAERLQYLEVQEAQNGRRSFDLNVYNASLELRDAQHLLARMREHFGVRPSEFQALYDQIKGRSFGHLAGGVHRDGADFFNVYYGVSGFPRFSERLG